MHFFVSEEVHSKSYFRNGNLYQCISAEISGVGRNPKILCNVQVFVNSDELFSYVSFKMKSYDVFMSMIQHCFMY